jgi:hypothetical protein
MKARASTSFTRPARERVEDHPLEALPDEASSPESPLLDVKAPSGPEATAEAPGQQICPCTRSTQSQVETVASESEGDEDPAPPDDRSLSE